MSTPSSQADLHLILSREEEAEVRYTYVVATPQVAPDAACLDHVGAHFPPGSRKGSYPLYPGYVEVSEDEAATPQPGANMPCTPYAYQYQNSHDGGLQHYSSSTPTRKPSQGQSYISPDGFNEIQRQRYDKQRRNHISTRSQNTQGSTPTQTREPSSSTASGHNEHVGDTAIAAPHGYTPAVSATFSEGHTPSHSSVVTNEDETYRCDVGPSPPYPYSEWDPYHNQYHAEEVQTSVDGWQWEGHH